MDETVHREAVWQIPVSEFSVFVVAYFLAFAHYGPGFRWYIDARIRSQGARGVLFPMPSRIIRLVVDDAFM